MNINELRSYKFLDMALFDFIATFIFTILFHYWMWKRHLEMKEPEKRPYYLYFISLLYIFLAFIFISTIIHWIFSTPTVLGYYLGFNDKPKPLIF